MSETSARAAAAAAEPCSSNLACNFGCRVEVVFDIMNQLMVLGSQLSPTTVNLTFQEVIVDSKLTILWGS